MSPRNDPQDSPRRFTVDRRKFLHGLALGGGAAVLFRMPSALAQMRATPHYYVHLQLAGGADWLLSLDSRERDVGGIHMHLDRQNDVRFQHTIDSGVRDADGQPVRFGPAFEPMLPHLGKTAIIRGIATNTVSHSVGTNYWLTARFPSGENPRGSSVPALVAAQRGEKDETGAEKLIPHLSVGAIQTFNDGLPSFASALNVILPSDFAALLGEGPNPAYQPELRRAIADHLAKTKTCAGAGTDRRGLIDRYLQARRKAQLVMQSDLASSLDLFAADAPAQVTEIRDRFGATANDPTNAAAYLAMSFLAIKNNLVNGLSVMLNVPDSHDGGTQAFTQAPMQHAAFTALSRFIDALAATNGPTGESLLSSTSIILSSEFGRTPEFNGVGGRDHWPYNSALIVSPVVKAGVFGSTDDQLLPKNVDPASGRSVIGSGVALDPANVTTSLLAGLGLDAQDLRAQPLPFLKV